MTTLPDSKFCCADCLSPAPSMDGQCGECDSARLVQTSTIREALGIEKALDALKSAVAHVRGSFGRDFIRALPLGKTLDAIDAGQDPGAVLESLEARRGSTLTYDELVVACRNIGHDLTCGACAEVFYTGSTSADHTCSRE